MADTDLARLAFEVDASGADKARVSLDAAAASADKLDSSLKRLSDTSRSNATASGASAADALKLTAGMDQATVAAIEQIRTMREHREILGLTSKAFGGATAEVDRTMAAMKRYTVEAERATAQNAALERQVSTLTGKLDPMAGATIKAASAKDLLNKGVAAGLLTQERANELTGIATRRYVEMADAQIKGVAGFAGIRGAINRTTDAVNTGTGAIRLQSHQIGMLGQQFQDVAVQLAGGQNPFLIAMQQAPQAAYAVGGFANAFSLLGGVIRAHPILAVASTIAATVGAFLLLRDTTKEATAAAIDHAAAIEKANEALDDAATKAEKAALKQREAAREGLNASYDHQQKELSDLAKLIVQSREMLADMQRQSAEMGVPERQRMFAAIATERMALAALEAEYQGLQRAMQGTVDRIGDLTPASLALAAEGRKLLAVLKETERVRTDQEKADAKAAETIRASLRPATKIYADEVANLTRLRDLDLIGIDEYGKAIANLNIWLYEQSTASKIAADQGKHLFDVLKQTEKVMKEAADADEKLAEQYRTKSATAAETYAAKLIELERLHTRVSRVTGETSITTEEYTRAVENLNQWLQEQDPAFQKAAKAAADYAKELERVVGRTTDRMVDFGADAFFDVLEGRRDDFWAGMVTTAKRAFAQMAADAFLRPIFQPIVQQVVSAAPGMFGLNLSAGNSNSQSGGGMPSFNPFSMFQNGVQNISSGIVNAFPSMFGLGSSTMAAAGSMAMGPGGMLLGGIDAAATAVAGATASVASFASIALPVMAIAIPILMSLFSKKPSVGPNSNATVGMRDGKLDVIDSGADNGGDRNAAITFAKDYIKTLEATLASIGGTLKEGFTGIQVGIFKNKFFVDDTRAGGTATYEKNQFDNEADAVADAIKRTLKRGVDGLSEDMKLVLANTTAKTMDDLNKDLTFGKNFRDQIDMMNAGLGTFTQQVTAFRIAAKNAADTEAASIKEFLASSKDLFAPYSETTTTRKQSLHYAGTSGGENNEVMQYADASDPTQVYQFSSSSADGSMRMVNSVTGEFITVVRNATTGLYEFDKTITTITRDGTNEQLIAARAAVKNRALSAIGLGPDAEANRPVTGIAAEYLAEAEKIKAWQKVLEAAGFTVAEATNKIAEATEKLKTKKKDDFNDSINARLASARGDSEAILTYVLKDIEKARQQELTNARALNGDIAAVEAYYAELRLQATTAADQAAYQKAAANATNLAAAMRLEGDETGAFLLDMATNAETRRREARAAGLDMVIMERLLAAERKKAMEDLGKAQAAKELNRVSGNSSLDSSLLRLGGNDRDADLMDFDVQTRQRRQAARDAGLDMVKFEDVVARERLAIIARYANDVTRATNQTAIENYNVQIDAQQKLYDAAARTADVMSKLADSLDKTRLNLRTGAASPFSGEQVLAELAANYNTLKTKALAGDEKALGEIGEAATKYAEFAKSYYGGNDQYATIFAGIDDTILKASQAATSQASIAMQQRDYAKTQVDLLTQARDALIGINNAIGSGASGNGPPPPPPAALVGGERFDRIARDAGNWDGTAASWAGLVSNRQSAIAEMTDTSELVRILYQYYGGRRTADANGDLGAVEIVARLHALNVPGYADGGMHMGGLRMVGERGPELEATGPARYWSAEQTSRMVGSNDNGEMVAQLSRIERAITGQTRVVAAEGEQSNATLARIADSNEDMRRRTALAEAA